MRVRWFRKDDAPITAQHYDESIHGTKAIDFSAPDMAAVFVLVDENEVPRMVMGARKTVEIMLVADPKWSDAAARMAGLRMLAGELFKALFAQGYRSAHCWIEEKLMKSYPRRLRTLGMERDPRASFRLEVE